MKINTKLHNFLIEEASIQNNVIAQTNTILLKRELLKERLKNYAMIIVFIMFVLVLFIMLYRFFPHYFPFNNTVATTQIADTKECPKQINRYVDNQDNFTVQETNDKKMMQPKRKLFNGTDYVKHDNFVYKRVWEKGILVSETRLKATIEDSRKVEKIPRFSKEIK